MVLLKPKPSCWSWSDVVAGPWLQDALDGLRQPDGLRSVAPPRALRAELRPYQELGVRWLSLLHHLGLGACLADDMGLGKTRRRSSARTAGSAQRRPRSIRSR
jgi:SNF2 family DNA or RNA helicase